MKDEVDSLQDRSLFPLVAAVYFVYSAIVAGVVYTTTLGVGDVWPALAFAWAALLIFAWFERSSASARPHVTTVKETSREWIGQCSPSIALGLSFLASGAIIASVTFYSGSSPIDVWNAALGGGSLYMEYQQYNEIFSAGTGPVGYIFFLLGVVGQLFAFYVLLVFLVTDRKFGWYRVACSLILVFASVYGSFARGTTFETFKMLLFLLLVLYLRSRTFGGSLRTALFATPLAVLVLGYFSFNVRSRGERSTECSSLDVCPVFQVPRSGSYELISEFSQLLYGYFGHGFYYLGVYLQEVVASDRASLMAALFPKGFVSWAIWDGLDRVEAVIDHGPRWRPDFALVINTYGILLLILFLAFLGWAATRLAGGNSTMGQ